MDSSKVRQMLNGERPRIPRLELLLLAGTLSLGALYAIYGLALPGFEARLPLVILLLVAAAFNLVLISLDRRHLAPEFVIWAARLGNVTLLTTGILFTGGFKSPFFALYAVYIVVASLRYGWGGTARSFVLCLVNWLLLMVMEVWSGHLDVRESSVLLPLLGQIGIWIGILGLVAAAVGALAQRHINLEEALLKRERELAFVHEAGRLLGTSLDPQQVLAVTLAQVSELIDAEAASLALVDHSTGRISFELVIGGGDKAVEGLRLEPGQGIVGQVIQQGQPILVSDAASDPRFYTQVDRISGYHTRSLLCVPLCVEGQIIGALEALNKRSQPFGEEDVRLLSALADLAAPAIQNARLHDQVQQNVQHLQEAYDEVHRLDELKSTFIRNISHELRTPLALMQGHLELILEDQFGPLGTEQRSSLTVVFERCSALTRMLNDFISLQTIGALGFDLEPLNVASLIEAAVEAIRPRAAKAQIQLALDLLPAEEVPPVCGDSRRLRRVLDHLLDNAIKFSPNGGLVCLSLGCEGQMLRVQVQDQGIGLPTEQLHRVFERFYQVDGSATRRYGGTGLGLAYVREVIEAHGGAVWAESEGIPGRGSNFSFFLPIDSGRQADWRPLAEGSSSL